VVADEVKELADTTSRSTEQIAETIQELERDTADMSGTIAAMVSGIGSVGDAATSLRAVAADQGTLVERLSGQMGQTIGRVEQMSGLAAQLERRQSDRLAASGSLTLRRAGVRDPIKATLLNVSSGGARIQVAPDEQLKVDDIVDTAVGRAGDPIPVHARVANRGAGPDGVELGLQFLVTDDNLATRLDRYIADLVSGGAAVS